ncbi:MAG TPA: response regulator [Nitrospiraceae bacterium]|nr:response regulator [Nitrospiraceae bacterium]
MMNHQDGTRPCAMIVEQDVYFGLKLADWLEGQGYQVVRVWSAEAAIEELSEVRPQAVFVGRDHSEPATQIGISEILHLIQTVCPGVPIITITGQSSASVGIQLGDGIGAFVRHPAMDA